MSTAAVKVPGVQLTLGGAAYVVAPLNAAAIKQHREVVGRFLQSGMPDIDVTVTLLHASLLRNYSHIKVEDVEEWVDFGNMVEIMDVVMHSSGLALAVGNLNRRIQQAMNPATASTS